LRLCPSFSGFFGSLVLSVGVVVGRFEDGLEGISIDEGYVVCEGVRRMDKKEGKDRGKKDRGRGKKEEGRGKREEGRGKREEGRGKREEGRGKREERGRREEGRGGGIHTSICP
jgi:hypothetical protein